MVEAGFRFALDAQAQGGTAACRSALRGLLRPRQACWTSRSLVRAPRHAILPDPTCTRHMLMCSCARVRCVCAGSLLLMLSSIDEAETLPEAAVHRPRVRAASRHVVGGAQAAPCASRRRLYSACCSRWSVATLSELERTVCSLCSSVWTVIRAQWTGKWSQCSTWGRWGGAARRALRRMQCTRNEKT